MQVIRLTVPPKVIDRPPRQPVEGARFFVDYGLLVKLAKHTQGHLLLVDRDGFYLDRGGRDRRLGSRNFSDRCHTHTVPPCVFSRSCGAQPLHTECSRCSLCGIGCVCRCLGQGTLPVCFTAL